MTQQIEKSVFISAIPGVVWHMLTDLSSMRQWMGEPEMKLEVMTDWKTGSSIVIKGFHHVAFENKGTVLKFNPHNVLVYTYLSSLSRLPDQPENYSIIEFRLASIEEGTQLILLLSNFPTEAIFKHIDFYWTTTLQILKDAAEQKQIESGIQFLKV